MSRLLETAWLTLALCGLSISVWRFVLDGPAAALWFLLLTLISGIFYSIRRKNRIKNEKSLKKQPVEIKDKAAT